MTPIIRSDHEIMGAVVSAGDPERVTRLLAWLDRRTDPDRSRVLLVDGWEAVADRAERDRSQRWFDDLVVVVREARARRLTVAITATLAHSVPSELRVRGTPVVALAGSDPEPDLDLVAPPAAHDPPGRARLVIADDALRRRSSAPGSGPMVQIATAHWERSDRTPGPPVRCGGADALGTARMVGAEDRDGGRNFRMDRHDRAPLLPLIPTTIDERQVGGWAWDLEHDAAVPTPISSVIWVLGPPGSGRTTALGALLNALDPGEHRVDPRALQHRRPPSGPSRRPHALRDRSAGAVAEGRGARMSDRGWDVDVHTHEGSPATDVTSVDGSQPSRVTAHDDVDRWDATAWSELEVSGPTTMLLAADPARLDRWNDTVVQLLSTGCGVMLRPDDDEDGRLLGAALPRARPFAMRPGRGWWCRRGHPARPIQIAVSSRGVEPPTPATPG